MVRFHRFHKNWLSCQKTEGPALPWKNGPYLQAASREWERESLYWYDQWMINKGRGLCADHVIHIMDTVWTETWMWPEAGNLGGTHSTAFLPILHKLPIYIPCALSKWCSYIISTWLFCIHWAIVTKNNQQFLGPSVNLFRQLRLLAKCSWADKSNHFAHQPEITAFLSWVLNFQSCTTAWFLMRFI